MTNHIMNDETMENISGGAGLIDYDTGKYILYTVVPNDCISAIAMRYDVTPDILYAINRKRIGSDINLIYPGMVLRVPTL